MDAAGVINGSGRNLPVGPSSHQWTVSGLVSGDTITFDLNYTTGTLVGYVASFTGMIDAAGEMNGTWFDTRWEDSGPWWTTCGQAVPFIILLTFPPGSNVTASVEILEEAELPPCTTPLPEGITPYIAVQILAGEVNGTAQVGVRYEDIWPDEEQEEALRLYMSKCVDFNLDGTINGQDLSLIKKGIRQGANQSSPWNVPFDVNSDGVVDEVDVAIVMMYKSQGLIVNEGRDGMEQARLPWIDITTYVDAANNIVYGETDHFSIFRCR
jgi:hypothetical protein